MPRRRLRVASYNVHRCIGVDARLDLARVARVISELDADAIGLQEVDGGYHTPGSDQLRELADRIGLVAVEGPTLRGPEGHYGSALLTHLPVMRVRRCDLSVPGREPRGVLDVMVLHEGRPIRLMVTHLGLGRWEQHRQIDVLRDHLHRYDRDQLTVLLGDVNQWWPGSRVLRVLRREFGRAPRFRTFPAYRPLLSLDRIFARPGQALARVWVHRSPLARAASDHLPVCAEIRSEATPRASDRGARQDFSSSPESSHPRNSRSCIGKPSSGPRDWRSR